MRDVPGVNCGCGGDDTELVGHCSECGTAKRWVSRGPHSQVFECPDCS